MDRSEVPGPEQRFSGTVDAWWEHPRALAESLAASRQRDDSLPETLRMGADEMPTRRLARPLRRLAAVLESPRPAPADVLEQLKRCSPELLAKLREGDEHGRWGAALSELAENYRHQSVGRLALIGALGYPAVVALLIAAMSTIIATQIVPVFRTLFAEFEIELPALTQQYFWLFSTGLQLALAVLAIFAVALSLMRILGGRVFWTLVCWSSPVVGNILIWNVMASATQTLAQLFRSELPTSDALMIAGLSSNNQLMREVLQKMAAASRHGMPLSVLFERVPLIPPSITSLVRWGEANGNLPEALESASEALLARIQIQGAWLTAVLPIILYVLVGAMAGTLILALVFPLTALIQNLS